MASNLRFSPLFFGVILLAGLLVYINWPASEEQQQRRAGGTPVVVTNVEKQAFAFIIESLGTAQANESVALTAQRAQIVTSVKFTDGDYVEAGDTLVELNNKAEKARVNELQINISEAKRQLRRIEGLAKERAASQQLLDEQQARVKALEAQLDVALANLSELKVNAPFAGKLGIRQVSVGALVRPGDVIATLDDISRIKVDFNLSENHLASVNEGQLVTATSVAYPGQTFTGSISTIDARLDPVTRSIQVRAIIDNAEQQLRPGMLLNITVTKRELETIVIPEKSLIPNHEKQFVFVIENDKAVQREVKVGERRPGVAQIIEGLDVGDVIVTEGTLRLQDGSPVQILENK